MRQVISVGVGDIVTVPKRKGTFVVISAYDQRVTEQQYQEPTYWGYQVVVLRKLNPDLSYNPKGRMIGLNLGGYIDEKFKLTLIQKNGQYYDTRIH